MRSAPRSPSTALRGWAVVTAVAVVLTACSGAEPSSTTTAPDAGGPPFTTSVTTPAASPGLATAVRAAGFDAGTAYVASTTTSSLQVTDGHTFVVTHNFPNGATAEMTYRLAPGAGRMKPADGVTISAEESGDRYLIELGYAVDAATIPADLRASILGGGGSAAGAPPSGSRAVVQRAGFVTQGEPGTVDVVVSGVISQAQETYVDSWADRAGSSVASGSWEAFKAGGKVWDAVGASDLISAALARLDALAECAANRATP